MFKISQRHGGDSGLMLWRIQDPAGRITGYAADLCETLIAARADGLSVVMLETPGGQVAIAILTDDELSAEAKPDNTPTLSPQAR